MGYAVSDDRLIGINGDAVTQHWTGNASARKIRGPEAIVVHGTFGNPFDITGSISWNQRTDIKGRSSAHIYIDREGKVHGMNRLTQVLWHAGASSWRGKKRCNERMIGIELACAGPLHRISDTQWRPKWDTRKRFKIDLKERDGVVRRATYPAYPNDCWWLDYTGAQIQALIDVCRALEAEYPSIDECVTHHDIAPKRKLDCAPTLDMIALNKAVFDCEDYFTLVQRPATEAGGDDTADAPISAVEAKRLMLGLGYRIVEPESPVVSKITRASILELQDDNGLETTGRFDRATLDLLDSGRASRRPDDVVAGETVSGLRKRGSTTIAAADNDERIALSVPAAFTGIAGLDRILDGQIFAGLSDMANGITSLVKPFGFAVTPSQLIIGCVVVTFSAYLLARAKHTKAKRLADARSGRKVR